MHFISRRMKEKGRKGKGNGSGAKAAYCKISSILCLRHLYEFFFFFFLSDVFEVIARINFCQDNYYHKPFGFGH